MQTGVKISGALHLGAILWVLLGGTLFRAPPPADMQVSDVSILSESEFAALVSDAPEADTVLPAPETPEVAAEAPAVPGAESAPQRPEVAAPAPPQPAEAEPDMSGARARAEAEADDTPPPAPVPPASEDSLPPAPAPDAPVAAQDREGLDRPQPPALETAAPRPAERVAPEATPAPDPDVARAEQATEATAPDPEAEAAAAAEPRTEAAPEAAATEIVTEAEEGEADRATAPLRTARPRARPDRPAPSPDPEPDTETTAAEPDPAPEEESPEDAIAAAIAADMANDTPPAGQPAARSGTPLTGGEREALRVAVQDCWNLGSLSSAAQRVVVTVGVSMSPDGLPIVDSIRQISATGGSGGAAQQAYEAARRAIIRCGRDGYGLPPEKYDQWRDIEMTFNPERMRTR